MYPNPAAWIDPSWDADDRDLCASWLRTGLVARAYMGYSLCRFCAKRDNGALEMTDGVYQWPEGLGHYVEEHAVRLPQAFVEHVVRMTESIESAELDESWWLSQDRK